MGRPKPIHAGRFGYGGLLYRDKWSVKGIKQLHDPPNTLLSRAFIVSLSPHSPILMDANVPLQPAFFAREEDQRTGRCTESVFFNPSVYAFRCHKFGYEYTCTKVAPGTV
ncbi:hypothetical protein N9526_01185 [Planktomarina temperata]|nr:hypothetical protein [Planktomarina temperata]